MEHALLVEDIPLVNTVFLPNGRVGESLIVDEIEQIEDELEGVFAFVSKQLRLFLIKILRQSLTSLAHLYIGVDCPVLSHLNTPHHLLRSHKDPS